MEHVNTKLLRVRRTARMLLVGQRVFQWLSVVPMVVLAMVLIDYWLRLPSSARLILGLALLLGSASWLISRLMPAMGFRPPLAALALRAEKMYPHLHGLLASGVEFAMAQAAGNGNYSPASRTGSLIDATVNHADRMLEQSGASLNRLIDPSRTIRFLLIAMIVVAGFTTVVAATPAEHRSTAVARWLKPFGDAAWPKRYEVVSDVKQAVWPIDTPLRLRAKVTRGYYESMRTHVEYRVIRADGTVATEKNAIMNEQGAINANTHESENAPAGLFEYLIDPVTLGIESFDDARQAVEATIEYRFATGDDETPWQQMQLVSRPAVRRLTLTIEPPTYARGLIDVQHIALDQHTGQVATAAALIGSQMTLQLELNKPIPAQHALLQDLLPGLPADATLTPVAATEGQPDAQPANGTSASEDPSSNAATSLDQHKQNTVRNLRITFRHRRTVETPIRLTDAHQLQNISQRLYRFEAIEDKSPSVSITEPTTDLSVLPRAAIDINSAAQDDVAVEQLVLQSLHTPNPAGNTGEGGETRQTPEPRELDQQTGRQERLTLAYRMDLAQWSVQPGDTIELTAIARDNFELEGEHHEPVRSQVKLIRIIDDADFANRIRSDFAALRQQAVRTQQQQRDLMQVESRRAANSQNQITRSIENQKKLLDRINEQMEQNRFADEGFTELAAQAEQLLNRAGEQSQASQQQLEQANALEATESQQAEAQAMRQQAQQQQQQVDRTLQDLINKLDQGRDALLLQSKLEGIAKEQDQIRRDTRELLPRTLGQSKDSLPQELQEKLNELAQREKELAEKAEQLIREMQSNAEALSKQEDIDSKSTAEAMREAAAIGQRQGLNQTMQQAGAQADENQLSQAGGQMDAAQDVLENMLQELKDRDKRKMQMLRRRLTQLLDALEKLRDQQKVQLERLAQAQQLGGLDQPQAALRRNTLDVAELARKTAETEPVADIIVTASDSMAEAVRALRDEDRELSVGFESQALDDLDRAIEAVKELQQKNAQEQTSQEREQLRKKYLELADRQDELRKKTAELTDKQLNRREQAQLRALGQQEDELRNEATELAGKVVETLIFRHLHEQIDGKAAGIVRDLRAGTSNNQLLRDQSRVAGALRTMAEALKQDPDDEDFNSPESGGGGGGGESGEPPLIPPLAELKALSGTQKSIYDETRQAGGDGDIQPDDTQLRELAEMQRELANMGERLLQQIEEQQQQPEPLPIPGDDDDDQPQEVPNEL